ncbi:hypothetical protein CALCODRAFT_502979 [Calocera cornea HHB12733]|uniref:Extracellular membrane protein CFEM domain-containing protein n=1 Tax=Calocera cornea HHB12733 TaxID=1353952 RepID=A0A165D206_9BASI|nr:hypothetical protein CALCODRAFT_502979 [Calocera cornea HHB12733]
MLSLTQSLVFSALVFVTSAREAGNLLGRSGGSLGNALGHRDVIRHPWGLQPRQSACASTCTAATDQQWLQAEANCNYYDINCSCNALHRLSSGCFACTLNAFGLSASSLNVTCSPFPTDAVCDNQCADESDQAALGVTQDCGVYALDSTCVCNGLSQVSHSCRNCTLDALGWKPNAYDFYCPSALCQTQCSPGDAISLERLDDCALGDQNCFCGNWTALSTTCLTCVLTESNQTSVQYEATCGVTIPSSQGASATGTGTANAGLPSDGALPTTSSGAGTLPSSGSSNAGSTSSSSTPTGAIVGGVVGGAVAIGLLTGVIIWLRRRKRSSALISTVTPEPILPGVEPKTTEGYPGPRQLPYEQGYSSPPNYFSSTPSYGAPQDFENFHTSPDLGGVYSDPQSGMPPEPHYGYDGVPPLSPPPNTHYGHTGAPPDA